MAKHANTVLTGILSTTTRWYNEPNTGGYYFYETSKRKRVFRESRISPGISVIEYD